MTCASVYSNVDKEDNLAVVYHATTESRVVVVDICFGV